MGIRILESHRGMGNLYSGDKLILKDIEYQFEYWQQMVLDGRGGEVPGLKDAAGLLIGVGHIQLFDLMGCSNIVLVLNDGRRWPVLLSDSNGSIRGRGALRAA